MNQSRTFLDIITEVTDPLLKLNYETLGLDLEYDYQEAPAKLTLKFQAGFPSGPLNSNLKDSYIPKLKAALVAAYPSIEIQITLSPVIKAHKAQLLGQALRGVKNTIAIASGKGGVGKSTVAVNLAVSLAKAGARVGILDADIYGPSIPAMLGATTGVESQGDRYLPVEAHGLYAMSIGYLMEENQALIWRGPMLAKSLLQMLDLTLWDNLDYLFIDLPPGTGDIQLSLVQKIPLSAAIVVTTPQTIATLDADKAIQMFKKTNIEVLGLIENMAYHNCSHCGHPDALFGAGGGNQLAEKYGLPLLGQLPLDSRIGRDCDTGKPTAILGDEKLAECFMKTALNASILLAKKPLNYAGKFPRVVVE